MTNYRGELQELCQKQGEALPVYKTANTGTDHEPNWFSTCNALGYNTGGTGSTIKEANSNAAQALLKALAEKSKESVQKDTDAIKVSTLPTDVNITLQTKNQKESQPHVAKLMFACVETDWDPVLIDHKYLNLQNCFTDMWQWENEPSIFNNLGREPNTPGEWYSIHVDGFDLVFHCPDGNPPTKESAILFG